MKRSEINRSIREALDFLAEHRFPLPEWATWTPPMWNRHGEECREIRDNALGWDVTDFGKGNFSREGLTLFTIRNGNPARDRKTYCEKIMFVREGQVTPIHFHWHKMEDIINRGGGDLCMKLWKADQKERMTGNPLHVPGRRDHDDPARRRNFASAAGPEHYFRTLHVPHVLGRGR